MQSNPWLKFFQQFLIAFALLTALGWLLSEYAWVYLFGALGLIGWHGYNIYRLETWLRDGTSINPPDSFGLWEDIFMHVYHLQRRNRYRQKKLAEILKRFRESAEAMPDGVIDLTREGDIVWWNSKAEQLLDLKKRKDQGQYILNLLRHPNFIRFFKELIPEQVLELPSPNDETLIYEYRIVPYGKEEFLLLVRDISERNRVTQMRRDFIANISHELRTPLTVVSGCIENLRDDDPPADWKRPLELIHEQSRRMGNLLTELLALSKLQSGGQAPLTDIVDVSRLVEIVVEQAMHDNKYALQTFEIDVDSELKVKGVETEVHSTVQNLIHNAVHYSPEGGRIGIHWGFKGDKAELIVSDQGIGIPPEAIPRLTERFYRTDEAREKRGSGSGLGLAIVKHVLSRHNALLTIESRVGEGSQFSCLFPADRIYHDKAKQLSAN